MTTTTIHFIRHGEVHNPHDIMYARLPRYRLSEKGKQQAKATAEFLKTQPLVAVFSSPMLRANQTARLIAAPHGLKVQKTALLNEILTPYEGKTHAFMNAIEWRMYDNIEPPYETPADILQRIRLFCQRILRQYSGRQVVAVTHGDVVLHAQLWARGLPLSHESRRSIQPYPATASISTLTFNSRTNQPSFEFHVPY